MKESERTLRQVLTELVEAGQLRPGSLVVLGCSTSEVTGGTIGHASAPQMGEEIAAAMMAACEALGLIPVFQCCEHLNRALVIEQEVAEVHRLTQVCAIPQPKAGGSVPAAAWKRMRHPALVQAIQADAAIDIGDTLVGMHLRPVAVPFRPSIQKLGEARIVTAYSRLPLIGGERAVYHM